MKNRIAAIAATFAALAFGQAAEAGQINLVTNGNFDQSTYANNNQFGSNWGGQGVTGWTGGTGYQLFFQSGQYTTSANSQYDSGYNTGKEMFYTLPNPGIAGLGNVGNGNVVGLDGDPTVGNGGSISQTITGLTVGNTYLLTFDWATGQLQSRSGNTTDQVLATLGNQSFLTAVVADNSGSSTPWLQQTFLYTATSATETLTFLAEGSPVGLPPMVALDGISLVSAPEPSSVALLAGGLGLLALAYRRRRAAERVNV